MNSRSFNRIEAEHVSEGHVIPNTRRDIAFAFTYY